MTITAKTLSVAWQDGGNTSGKSYIVTKRLISAAARDMANAADLAALRTAALADPLTLLGTFSLTTCVGTMRVRNFQLSAVQPSEGKIFDATITYGTEYGWTKSLSGATTLMLPVEVTFQAADRQVAVYRNPSWTTSPAANLNTTADIGGTKVDEEAVPVEGRINQTVMGISIVFDTTQKSLTTAYDVMDTCRGKWNSAAFVYWNANQVYCADADIQQVRDEFYRASFKIVWDEWLACEQVPGRDQDNVVRKDANGKAKDVYWRSINRSTVNLDNQIFTLSPDAAIARHIAKNGSWVTRA